MGRGIYGWSSPDRPVVSALSAAAPLDRGAHLGWVGHFVVSRRSTNHSFPRFRPRSRLGSNPASTLFFSLPCGPGAAGAVVIGILVLIFDYFSFYFLMFGGEVFRRHNYWLHAPIFFFVLILVFVTRYMRPGGPWQRLCRCPLRDSDGLF